MSMDRWAPKADHFRKPTDVPQRNGLFRNWPRFLTFGGLGSTKDPSMRAGKTADSRRTVGESHAGPISDRGKGKR